MSSVSSSQKTEFCNMAKVALLVDFNPRTRVVVDIPDNVEVDKWLEDDNNFGAVAKKAREQILENRVEDYLCGENMYWEEDLECPFGSLTMDNE